MTAEIYKSSKIADTVKIYDNVRCKKSTIGEYCCIGDDCDIESLVMEDRSELGRRNLIRKSTIGKGTYTGTNTIIKNSDIGRYCCISWNVSIGGGNHNYNNVSCYTDYWYKRTFGVEVQEMQADTTKTIIGNDVWIAAGVNIIGGVKIGDGSIIGAGCVVTKDIPPYSIVVGVPGKIIKTRFEDQIIELLEQLKWWNWSEDKIKKNIDFLRDEPTVVKLQQLINESKNFD